MADVLSNWAANTAISAVLAGNCYLACHLSDPGSLGDTTTEVAGGGYIRQKITFHPASGRTAVSSNAQTFPGMPACTVTHLAVWTAVSGGHLVFSKALSPAIAVSTSGQLLAAAGDVAISL